MHKLIFPIFSLVFIVACATFEKDELYGHWKNETWELIFREDGTCKVGNRGVLQGETLKFTTLGNTLEISKDGRVIISNLTIKSIKNDQLTLEFRNLVGSSDKMEVIEVLTRQ